ncbi:hypothetical protein EF847_12220 [Actinobacteria bacterium YIM 96077]|uniref:Leucine-binding protein domain-containing protein n=1 Tax=Phytoactinopolyspora halophila TaxID=1981511 RepID=A0A329QYT3_9ACTN|nr:ABC transporter substrate-binding protein [Phytoactinopolyspora halophila]AYY13344.1 hypothetical protein EF847_12220 [Actinobacteria bacterium YIM 96077]RAW17421.1 hypothetical protein DPM12_05210 [Phytoactinopolyspora halophila]
MRSRITRLPRRSFVAIGITASAAIYLAACTPPGQEEGDDTSAESDGGADTFRVGLVGSLTGFASATGEDMQQGWDLYWERNDGPAGLTVESIFEDAASDPDTALTKATRLVEEEDVDVIVGPVLASSALAVADYATETGVANLSQTSADDITQRESSPLVLRTGALAGSQTTFAAGQWAIDNGYETAATICPDYAFGWDGCGGFVSAFEADGGEVIEQLWYPNSAPDLSNYVAQLASADADVIFSGTTGGSDAGNFIREASNLGLLGSTPIVTGAPTTSSGPLNDVGDISIGLKSAAYYAPDSEAGGNPEFREAYEEEYGEIASIYASGAYLTAQLVDAALEEAGEKVEGEELIETIKEADVPDAVWGDVSFDEYNGIVVPVYIRTVQQRDDGELWNVVEERFDDVSQFWTFDPDEWLESPAFSQDYQSFTDQ